MIEANKRLLKANLTQGVLTIQTNLINLYTNNLNSVAIQAALISGFAFQAIYTIHPFDNDVQLGLGYVYYTFFTVSLVTALFVLSQATIVVLYGPTMALKGNTDDAVKIAAYHMRAQQLEIFQASIIAISSFLFGSFILSWIAFPNGLAAITSVCYIFAYYFMVRRGMADFRTFTPNDDTDEMPQHGSDGKALKKNIDDELTVSIPSGNYPGSSIDLPYEQVRGSNPYETIKLKHRGLIWKRQPLEKGGFFSLYYGVLEKGRLDFYQNEKEYKDHSNPVNKKPIKLSEYDLETDPRKYKQNVTTIGRRSLGMKTSPWQISSHQTVIFNSLLGTLNSA